MIGRRVMVSKEHRQLYMRGILSKQGHVLVLQRGDNGRYGVWDTSEQGWAINPYMLNGGRTLSDGCGAINTYAGRITIANCIDWMDRQ